MQNLLLLFTPPLQKIRMNRGDNMRIMFLDRGESLPNPQFTPRNDRYRRYPLHAKFIKNC